METGIEIDIFQAEAIPDLQLAGISLEDINGHWYEELGCPEQTDTSLYPYETLIWQADKLSFEIDFWEGKIGKIKLSSTV